MPRMRRVKRYFTFRGRGEAGPCPCPICNRPAKILKYKAGETESTLICPACGWYVVPVGKGDCTVETTVEYYTYEEVRPRAKK